VEHVRPRPARDGQVTERGPGREFVRTQERGVGHPGRPAHAFGHELVESNAADPLGDQREHDIPAVAIGEPLARGELGGVPAEHGQVVLGGRQVLRRHREQVVGDVVAGLLVEVVADARPVGQQVLDGNVVADEREIFAEYRARGRGHGQRVVVDQADHGERGEPFGPAGDGEPGANRVRYLAGAVSQAICLGEFGLTAAVHGHDTGESVLISNRVDRL
jgi:hypothetical protein